MNHLKQCGSRLEFERSDPIRVLLLATAYDQLEPTKQTAWHDGSTIKKKFLSPPLGVHRVAFFTEEALEGQVKVEVMDPMLHGFDAIAEFIKTQRPAVIGFSPIRVLFGGDRHFMEQVYQVSEELPNYRPLFIAGGIDASTAENNLFSYLPWLDLTVTGYGEKVLPQILGKILKHDCESVPLSARVFHDIAGVVPPGGRHLEGLGFNARQLITAEEFHRFATYIGENIPYEDYWAHNRQVNPNSLPETPIEVARVHTTSFCPYDCPFCAHQEHVKELHGRRLFMLSPSELLDMVTQIVEKTKAKGIYFNDDEMFSGPSRVKQFLKLVIDAKANGQLPQRICFYGQTRVDSVDEEILSLAGEAGWAYISYGVESFSDEALKSDDLRKQFTSEEAQVAVRRSLRHIPITNVNLILFYPSVTRQTFIETVETVYGLLCDSLIQGYKMSVNPFPTVEAYPQAPINAVAKQKGYPSQGRYVTDASGRIVYLPESYLPLDPHFRKLGEKEGEGEGESLILREMDKVFNRLKQDPRWPKHTISRSTGVNGLVFFITAYELLKIGSKESLISVQDMEDLIFKLIRRFEKGGIPWFNAT